MAQQNSAFETYYKNNVGSGAELALQLNHEISQALATIGVDWNAISSKVPWEAGKGGKVSVNGQATGLLKGFRNSVGVYASYEICPKTGVEYPWIVAKNKGGKGAGDTVNFSGLSALWEMFKQDNHLLTDTEREYRARERKKREAEQARKQEAARRNQEKLNKRRAANVQTELQNHDKLPRAADFVYTTKKKIADILSVVDARQGSDKHGNYISFLLHYVDKTPAGVQRIYDRKITKPDGSKTNKDFTWGMEKDGAHFILGKLEEAERVYVVEGFATGASVYLAMQLLGIPCAVIVAMDAGNKLKVVEAYHKAMPHLPLMDAADNDVWKQKKGKGNAGLNVALELLATYDNLAAYAPDFTKIDKAFQPTDWNDLHCMCSLKEVARQLKGNLARVRVAGDLFEQSLHRLKYANWQQVQEVANKCMQAGMNVGMPTYRPSDVIAMIRQVAFAEAGIPKERLNLKKLSQKATRIWHAKVKEAQLLRSFSPRITRDDERPEHIEYHKFNKSVIDEEVLEHIYGLDGIVIVRFPMGSRKTQGVIKPIMWDSTNSLFSAHRISLIGGAVDVLNKKPNDGDTSEMALAQKELMQNNVVFNYQEPNIKEMMPSVQKLACCINSILRPEFTPLLNGLDACCFDEAAQTLRHVTSGGAIKYPVAVFNKWLQILAATKEKVILADADANDLLVEFAELGLKQRNAHMQALYGDEFSAQKIHIIDGVTDCSDTSVYYTDTDTAFYRAIKDVKDGHKVLIANDSAKDGEKLYTMLQREAPDKKGLFISLDTKESERAADVERFTDNPNQESLKYDYLIYSPSISSGVSLENGHFNKHYGLFCGTVAPSDAIQMVRRDRKAREFVLGLATMHSSREESAMAMWLGMILANDNQLQVELNRESGKIELQTENLEFDRLRLDLIAQETRRETALRRICWVVYMPINTIFSHWLRLILIKKMVKR